MSLLNGLNGLRAPSSSVLHAGRMVHSRRMNQDGSSSRHLIGVALISASLLMIELALTRIFSVVMYYHFAFLAISIALFGISASGVVAYVGRHWLSRFRTDALLSIQSLC